jgi:hypothetical protein
MAHGGLSILRILLHITVLVHLDARLKDSYKAKIDASKKLQHANPVLRNMPPNNPRNQRA